MNGRDWYDYRCELVLSLKKQQQEISPPDLMTMYERQIQNKGKEDAFPILAWEIEIPYLYLHFSGIIEKNRYAEIKVQIKTKVEPWVHKYMMIVDCPPLWAVCEKKKKGKKD